MRLRRRTLNPQKSDQLQRMTTPFRPNVGKRPNQSYPLSTSIPTLMILSQAARFDSLLQAPLQFSPALIFVAVAAGQKRPLLSFQPLYSFLRHLLHLPLSLLHPLSFSRLLPQSSFPRLLRQSSFPRLLRQSSFPHLLHLLSLPLSLPLLFPCLLHL